MIKHLRQYLQSLEKQLFNKEWIGSPDYEALRFTIIYIFVGLVWIIWSDDLLAFFVHDIKLVHQIQTLKGWFYVFMSGLLFSVILKRRIRMIKNLSDSILFQNTHDTLTKLPNRALSGKIINKRIEQNPDLTFALVSLDIDDFANVNELLGYQFGDNIILSLTDTLSKLLDKGDSISRNGDGFILILDISNRTRTQLNQLLNKILVIVSSERVIDHQTLFITCSMGISVYPKDGQDFSELFRAADTALRHIKGVRKNSYNFYTEDYHITRVNRIKKVNELKKSIDQEELYLLYQPIFDMKHHHIHSFEALIRWNSPTFGLVPPTEFIAYAESTNLISHIDEFVFSTSLKLRHNWYELGDDTTILSINLSSKGLVDPSFIHTIERLCIEYHYIPNSIQIEITETAFITNFELAKSHLNRLKHLGFTIALDDFGTGYSSLAYLHQLKIDSIKIDRSFSINPGSNPNLDIILEEIIHLAHMLNLNVIAEGIETELQKNFFLDMNCRFGQGYLFARPEAEDIATQRVIEQLEKKIKPNA